MEVAAIIAQMQPQMPQDSRLAVPFGDMSYARRTAGNIMKFRQRNYFHLVPLGLLTSYFIARWFKGNTRFLEASALRHERHAMVLTTAMTMA